MTTQYSVIDREPSRRYPVYTRGNSGEVFPNVMSPMTGSLIGDAANLGQVAALVRLGVLTADDRRDSTSIGTGVFGGYLYGNLSLMRVVCERTPGMSPDDADRLIAGISDDAPPHRRQPGDRNWKASLRSSLTMGRALVRPDIGEVDAARRATDRWCAGAPSRSTSTDAELVAFVRSYPPRFADGMCRLLTFSAYAGAAGAAVDRLADRAGVARGTAIALTAGLGTIDSARPAVALWELGRLVADSAVLTRLFDAGDDPLDRRGGPDVARFSAEFDAFVTAHGARGPDEWELASPTWGTDPSIALAAVERLRHAPPERDPLAARRRLAADRARAVDEVRSRLSRPLRRPLGHFLRAAALYAESRERAKAVFVTDLYPVRLALLELGERLVARDGESRREDVFLATIDELPGVLADPGRYRRVLDERQRRQDWLQEREPPFVFEGRIPDPSTWPLRSAPRASPTADRPRRIVGQGVCPGVASGPARIITDPADPKTLEPGDVLVAPITDPAWTPLFLGAVAVVVDVGAQLSHAAIVARELGIPAVVGATGASRLLVDGDLIEVDGATGVVRLL